MIMQLYQLRRAIRQNGKFSGEDGTARQWVEFIDYAARDIWDTWPDNQDYSVFPVDFEDDGMPKCIVRPEPFEVKMFMPGEPIPTIDEHRVYITPAVCKFAYGNSRFLRIVCNVQEDTLYIWTLGGLCPKTKRTKLPRWGRGEMLELKQRLMELEARFMRQSGEEG